MRKYCVLVVAMAVGGCSKKPEPAPPMETSRPESGATLGAAQTLCIDPGDIQIEPLDLEALDDETPSVELGDKARAIVDGFTEHSSPVAAGEGRLAVAFVRCNENGCEPGVMVMDDAGQPLSTQPLPGVSSVAPGERLDLVSALADVDSNGRIDLWLSYRSGAPEREPSTHHTVALSLPSLLVQWHGEVSKTAPSEDGAGCDGTVYPVDADCDGDGDLVLVQRCGSMRCINDDSSACAADAVAEQVAIYFWNPAGNPKDKNGTYELRR